MHAIASAFGFYYFPSNPSPAQSMRGRLKPGLRGSLQGYQVAAGFAEYPLGSCLDCLGHPSSMISSLPSFFQWSSRPPPPVCPSPLCRLHLLLFPLSLNQQTKPLSSWLSPLAIPPTSLSRHRPSFLWAAKDLPRGPWHYTHIAPFTPFYPGPPMLLWTSVQGPSHYS